MKTKFFIVLSVLILGFSATNPDPSWASGVGVDSVVADAVVNESVPSTTCSTSAPVSTSCGAVGNNPSFPGEASSSANLATGTLAASINGYGSADAAINAYLTFVLPAGYTGVPCASNPLLSCLPVGVTWYATGTVSGNAYAEALVEGGFSLSDSGGGCIGSGSGETTCLGDHPSLAFSVTAYVPLTDLVNDLFYFQVTAYTNTPGSSSTIDPDVSLTLPEGVTFTSQSGEFLTGTPLPAALPLFATGLGGFGLLGWRRKRKASLHV